MANINGIETRSLAKTVQVLIHILLRGTIDWLIDYLGVKTEKSPKNLKSFVELISGFTRPLQAFVSALNDQQQG